MSRFAALIAAVSGLQSVAAGAEHLLTDLHARLQAAAEADDMSEVQAIVDDLNASKAELAAAVVANTPAADAGNGSDTSTGGADTSGGTDTSTDTTSGASGDDTVGGGSGDDTVGAGDGSDTQTDTTGGGQADDTTGASGASDTIQGGDGEEA